jgi:hypothetical protein
MGGEENAEEGGKLSFLMQVFKKKNDPSEF